MKLPVKVAYQIRKKEALADKELPFVIGVLADLSGKPEQPLPEMRDRDFIDVDPNQFDPVLEGVSPRLAFRVDNKMTDDDSKIAVELIFRSIKDFHPERIANEVEPLRRLVDNRKKLSSLLVRVRNRPSLADRINEIITDPEKIEQIALDVGLKPPGQSEIERDYEDLESRYLEAQEEIRLADQIIDKFLLARSEDQRHYAAEWLGAFIEGIIQGEIQISKDCGVMIDIRIAQIDQMISSQLNEILHHPDFQKLESTWRALHTLVSQSGSCSLLRVRVFNVNKKELLRDLERGSNISDSSLFEKVYVEGYGTWGGEPFGVLIGDYHFSCHPQDLVLLEKIARVASAARAPFVSAGSYEFFGFYDYNELSLFQDLNVILSEDQYCRWNHFREMKESNNVFLVISEFMVRLPYGKDLVPMTAFDFEEEVGSDPGMGNYLWGNAVYVLACLLAKNFAKYHWCSAVGEIQNGGLFSGLTHSRSTEYGDESQIGPTVANISNRRAAELAKMGFSALCGHKLSNHAAFYSVHSCHKIRDEDENISAATASTSLHYNLAVSRFAHYIGSMVRDNVGCFRTTRECETYLNKWISAYVLPEELEATSAGTEVLLRAAKLTLLQDQQYPDAYAIHARLTPCHYLQDSLCEPTEIIIRPPNRLKLIDLG